MHKMDSEPIHPEAVSKEVCSSNLYNHLELTQGIRVCGLYTISATLNKTIVGDKLDDSQDSQKDMFDPPGPSPPPSPIATTHGTEGPHGLIGCNSSICSHVTSQIKRNNSLLEECLTELKRLQQAVEGQGPQRTTIGVVIEKSPLEKPLYSYLKERFSHQPFLEEPDNNLKSKILSLRRKYCPEADQTETCKAGFRYACRKFVDFRSHAKSKLTGREDCGQLDLEELQRKLFGRSMTPSDQSMNLTVALRSFCYEKKLLWRNQGTPLTDFWGDFLKFFKGINENKNEEKWAQLIDREKSRIIRYKALPKRKDSNNNTAER